MSKENKPITEIWLPCKAGQGFYHETEEQRKSCVICNPTHTLIPNSEEPLGLVIYEYIHKISRRICPSLDHEEIAMDLWCKCWQEKRMPTYTQVKNHCLDALRKDKVRVKHEIKAGDLQFLGNKLAVELPNDLLDLLISRANLFSNESEAIHKRFYLGQSADYDSFEAACEKLQQAWKEYQRERDEQE